MSTNPDESTSTLARLLTAAPETKPNPTLAVANLATDKGVRVFMEYINRLPKARFDLLAKAVKTLFQIAQNDMVATEDSSLMQELVKYPHVAQFLKRICAED